MTTNLALKEQEVPQGTALTFEARVFLEYHYSTRHRRKFLKDLMRANVNIQKQLTNKTKFLSLKAVEIANTILNKLLTGKEVLLSHKYLTKITKCNTSKQNNNILNELRNLFDITHHNFLYRNGHFYRHHVEIRLKASIVIELKDLGVLNSEFYWKFISSPINNNKDLSNRKNRSNNNLNFSNNSNLNNRTEESDPVEAEKDFIKKKVVGNAREKVTNTEKKTRVYTPQKDFLGGKHLADMQEYLTPEMCSELNFLSGREFSDNAIKEIMAKVARSPNTAKNIFFLHINGFKKYMTRMLKGELRDAVQCQNNNFYIKSNKSESEIVEIKTHSDQRDFLGSFEDLSITLPCPDNQLKAKWACTLPTNQVYNFLSNFVRMKKIGTVLEIGLSKNVELTEHSKGLMLQGVKAVGEFMEIEKLEIIV